MKIALLILPMPFLKDQKRNAPLGILYVAGVLERAGYEVTVTDLRNLPRSEWLKPIPEADLYGMGATSVEYPEAVEIARSLKGQGWGPIVLGGVHASVSSPDSLDPAFDVLVQGEGEEVVLDLVSDFQKGQLKKAYRGGRIQDLDSLPFPARHLLPYDSIVSDSLVERGQLATTIITSRGCPFDCIFCANRKLWGRLVRYHAAERVALEVEFLIDTYGTRQFRFHDDMMTINKPRLRKLARLLGPLGIKWRCNGRVDHADIETLTLLKEAGCDEVGFGVETSSQEALNRSRKRTTVKKAYEAVANCKKVGLQVRLYFVLGLPGDFGDMSGRNLEFIKSLDPSGVNLSTLSPFPGSEIWDSPENLGMRIVNKDLSKYRIVWGLDEGEADEDFVFEYDEMSNDALKYHRRVLLEYVRQHGLDLNR